MQKWEYGAVYVTVYREGSGGPPREVLEISLPGTHRTTTSDPYGSIGLLNRLGAEGWELVDLEGGSFYLKRPVKS